MSAPSEPCECLKRHDHTGRFVPFALTPEAFDWATEHRETRGAHYGLTGPGSSSWAYCPRCPGAQARHDAAAEADGRALTPIADRLNAEPPEWAEREPRR